jgi:hypothetical protein
LIVLCRHSVKETKTVAVFIYIKEGNLDSFFFFLNLGFLTAEASMFKKN